MARKKVLAGGRSCCCRTCLGLVVPRYALYDASFHGRFVLVRGCKIHNLSKFCFSSSRPQLRFTLPTVAHQMFSRLFAPINCSCVPFFRIGALGGQAGSNEEEQRALGMLEHLAFASCEDSDHRRRTRARGNSSARAVSFGVQASKKIPMQCLVKNGS